MYNSVLTLRCAACRFGLPSVLQLLLFPLLWVETILQWVVAYSA
jgi:hypothetical protein